VRIGLSLSETQRITIPCAVWVRKVGATRLDRILRSEEGTRFSLEVFPPKAREDAGINIQERIARIFDTVEVLKVHDPLFVSVTYNTAHLTKATSIPVAAMIKERWGIETVAHLTCINTPLQEVERTFTVLQYFNIDTILALRGDRTPQCGTLPECMDHASDMVAEIRNRGVDLSVGVACYPEGHPESVDANGSRDLEVDLRHFQEKVRAGADFAISQLFLDNGAFLGMVEKVRMRGIDIPIVPGIMPITGRSNLKMVRNLTGAYVPTELEMRIIGATDAQEMFEAGIEHAVKQCKGLMDRVPCIHFYTMDSWEATDRIIRELI